MTVEIQAAGDSDLDTVMGIHRAAFGQAEEADLTRALLGDPTAAPALSLLAFADGQPVGHVLFTRVSLGDGPDGPAAAILCPLAVLPEAQRKGAGSALIRAGLDRLRTVGCELVFVLGDPGYYGRSGFQPIEPGTLEAPFPLTPFFQAGWQVQALTEAPLPTAGQVRCADALDRPEFWSE